MSFTFPLVAGILASMLHVISGPDHLAAISPWLLKLKRKPGKLAYLGV